MNEELLKRKTYYYDLPKELIAQTPLKQRDSSRLLLLDRKSGEVKHNTFKNITDYLKRGDCLVINNTRVIPARLIGEKVSTLGKVEFLLLKNLEGNKWQVLVKPGKKALIGSEFIFGENLLKAKVIDMGEGGTRIIEFSYTGIFNEILDKIGIMPLPPYITNKLEDKERYQTIYSKHEGSSAAPTAGLHFTEEVFNKLKQKGIEVCQITLHVGLGTFRPVKEENILEHKMHSEYFLVNEEAASKINNTKKSGGRVIAVGTTSCRVLESIAKGNEVSACSGETDIFIYPGYEFKILDGLITNFHLPESTLIMLVSAFAGYENTINAYKKAIEEKYRFFSFGDAMFIS